MYPMKRKLKPSRHQEAGSISFLIISLFLVLLILAFEAINISSAYLAKRELLSIGEAAIQHSAHSLDLRRYYANDQTLDQYSPFGSSYRVPIDCSMARQDFYSQIAQMQLRGNPISVSQWSCQLDVLDATLESQVEPTLTIPILASMTPGAGLDKVTITAGIGATSLMNTQ